MLGSMITKIRKDKNITKAELARRTGLNIGHLTHIEKGERSPSHKTLNSICHALDIPFKTLACLYDKEFEETGKRCKMVNHLSYNKVLAVDSYSNFVECPSYIPNASVAIKILDDAMEPILLKDSYAFLELNVPLNTKEIGLFKYQEKFIVRRLIIRKDKLVLRADNKAYADIDLSENDTFTIIGRVFYLKK